MSSIKVREEGYYLVKNRYSAELQIGYLKGECIWDSQLERYEKIGADDYGWIAEEPLDLESIRLLMMNGGLENAVEVVNNDSSKTSSVLFLEKELKRYKDWYGDMDSLSR